MNAFPTECTTKTKYGGKTQSDRGISGTQSERGKVMLECIASSPGSRADMADESSDSIVLGECLDRISVVNVDEHASP